MNLERHADLAALVGRLFYSSLYILYGYFKQTGSPPGGSSGRRDPRAVREQLSGL
jgi:hypothetical protein